MSAECKTLDTFYEFLTKTDKRILAPYGGAGSGKSVAVAQYLCEQLLTSVTPLKILCTRKTLPSLKITSLELVRKILSEWEVLGTVVQENKSDLIFTYGKNRMIFKSLDDPEKIKSFEADIVWIEEATELTKEDFMQLDIRLTRTKPDVKLIMTFNPIDAHHWLITDIVQGNDKNVAVHHSTYRDNPFLESAFVDRLKGYEKKDINFYRVYCLGEPGVLENIIYNHYTILASDAWPIGAREEPIAYGMDFGYSNESAAVSVKEYEGKTYVKELLYRTHLDANDIVEWAKSQGISTSIPIFCDSARPEQIETLHRAGFNAKPVSKGKDSVAAGIGLVRSKDLVISADSINLIKEMRGYHYQVDKNGHVIEDPVDAFNHAVDGLRYAIYGSSEPDELTWIGGYSGNF